MPNTNIIENECSCKCKRIDDWGYYTTTYTSTIEMTPKPSADFMRRLADYICTTTQEKSCDCRCVCHSLPRTRLPLIHREVTILNGELIWIVGELELTLQGWLNHLKTHFFDPARIWLKGDISMLQSGEEFSPEGADSPIVVKCVGGKFVTFKPSKTKDLTNDIDAEGF